MVQNRIRRLSRQLIAYHSSLSTDLPLSEELCADGFESFCLSQYFPNNIHTLIGNRSQFVYFLNAVTIRRKGRMRAEQKVRRAQLEKHYRADPQGIKKSFRQLVRQLLRIHHRSGREQTILYTDEKYEYVRALMGSKDSRDLIENGGIVHQRISSRRVRNLSNPLFSVNYIDREIRKDLANHVRETVQFGRNLNDLLYRLMIYVVNHNYRKVYRIGKEREDGRVHAEVAGIERRRIEKEWEVNFEWRRYLSHVQLPEYWRDLWLREVETPMEITGGYVCKHWRW